MPRALKLWGVLTSICVLVEVLLASAFPWEWVVIWPGALSLISSAVFLYFLSLPTFRELKNLSVVCWILIRSRRHFEGGLEGYTPSLDLQLDGLSGVADQLRGIAEELDWRVKASRIRGRAS